MPTTHDYIAIITAALSKVQQLADSGRQFDAIEMATVAARANESLVDQLVKAEAEKADKSKRRQLCKIVPNVSGGYSLAVKDSNGAWRSLGSGPRPQMLQLARFNGFEVEAIESHLAKPHADKVAAYITVNQEVAHA